MESPTVVVRVLVVVIVVVIVLVIVVVLVLIFVRRGFWLLQVAVSLSFFILSLTEDVSRLHLLNRLRLLCAEWDNEDYDADDEDDEQSEDADIAAEDEEGVAT